MGGRLLIRFGGGRNHPRLYILAGRPPQWVASQPVKGFVFLFF
jgi:hypothetical protein